jgi:hypothetical protein
MKKIITLLFCVGTIATVSAQTPQEEARRVILGGGKNKGTDKDTRNSRDVIIGGDRRVDDQQGNTYPYPGNYPNSGSREAQIDQVNRDYDAKIQSIRNNPYLSAEEKERTIRQLNNDRNRVIRQINGKTADRRDRRDDDDDDYKKDKKHKSNNGNHYGWEKGKGNPHKSGGSPNGKGNGNGKSKGKGKN